MRPHAASLTLAVLVAAAPVPPLVPVTRAQEPRPPAVRLPAPLPGAPGSVEAALAARRSVREFRRDPITLQQAAQVLWATDGATQGGRRRTAPSAGATYPLEIYLLAGAVEGLEPGIYRYRPQGHELVAVTPGDRRRDLAAAALRQEWLAEAAAVVAIAAVYERTARRYGTRAERYVPIEAGLAAQNLYLQAEVLGLATCYVGAFDDSAVARVLALQEGERPLAILPVGHPR